MIPNHDTHDNPSQPDADRPPQLNTAICGNHSGHFIGNDCEGDSGSEDDAASTLVGSEVSNTEYQLLDGSRDLPQTADIEIHAPSPSSIAYIDEFRARIELIINTESLQHVFEFNNLFYHLSQVSQDQDMDSMMGQPDLDGHSAAVSECASVRSSSPGPGLGAWCLEYHFVAIPLRLTPQERGGRPHL